MADKNYSEFYEELSKQRGSDDEVSGLNLFRMQIFVDKIRENSKKRKSVRILDVGSRNAWLKKVLESSGIDCEYNTLDISSHYVKLMRKNKINAHLGDISNKTKFKSEEFDFIVLGEILEHLPNAGLALDECKRILKRDGLIVGSVPNVWNAGSFAKILLRKDGEPSGQHIHWFDKDHLRNLFNFYNLNIIEMWVSPFSYVFLKIGFLNRFLSKLFNMGTNIYFVVKKK